MTEPEEAKKFEQLLQRIDPQSKLLRACELKGGASARVTALEVLLSDGHTKKMIVRQHGDMGLKQDRHVAAADEFKLLQTLKSVGLPVPTPYYFDQSGEIFPTPCVVTEFIEGHTELAPSNLADFILQLATILARIHSVDCSSLDLSFLREQEKRFTERLEKQPASIDESLNEGAIRDALKSAWPLPMRNKSVLLHGDFWPGNTLWKDSQLVAIIDWEDAKLGDPLADIANGRLEILWAFGIGAMNDFTDHYRSAMRSVDFTDLPYWDLCAALRAASNISEWGLDESTGKRFRERHRLFLTQAFERLRSLGKLS
jgi:aminoglycoside phosphotransferase (APT) family kinase protein